MNWLLRVTLAALLASALWGFRQAGLFEMPVWTPDGLTRFWLVNAGYAAAACLVAWWRPLWLLPAAASAALLYASYAAGPRAVSGALLVLGSSASLGSLLLGSRLFGPPSEAERRLLAPALGVGVWSVGIGLAAHWPVNHAPVYWAALAMPVILERGQWLRGWTLKPALSRREAFAIVLAGFPLLAHFLAVLMPESSADGLAMHLTIAAWVANFAQWHFDPNVSAWAVYPMGGDWIYTGAYLEGGEFAARLSNLGVLLLWCALTYRVARFWTTRVEATLLTALFLSTPLAYLVTGSLFVENFWGYLLSASLLAVWRGLVLQHSGLLRSAAVLLGAAIHAKFGAAVMLPLLAALILILYPRKRMALAFAAIALLVAIPPYANAWRVTGNPFYPYLSTAFPSSRAPNIEDLDNPYFRQPFDWRLLYRATFRSQDFLEARAGSIGWHVYLLLPLAALWFTARGGLPAVVIAMAIVYCWLTSLAQNNLRYYWPAFAWLTVPFAALLSALRERDAALRRVLLALSVFLVSAQTYYLAASGWQHRKYALKPLAHETEQYVKEYAPTRPLIEQLNQMAPGEKAAVLTGNAIAGLKAPALTASWHTYLFWWGLLDVKAPVDVLALMEKFGVRWFIGPAAANEANPSVAHFLEVCTDRQSVFGREAIYRLRSLCAAAVPGQAAERPVALAGRYDDVDLRILYQGTWMRDRQFAEPVNRTLTYTDVPGDSFQISFVGSELIWRFTRAANRGVASVEIDGKPVGEVDQYSADTRWRSQTEFRVPHGRHTAVFRILPRRHPRAEGGFIDIDEIEIR